MSLLNHIKEHAMLGINGIGADILTVGNGGQYATIQSAIDAIEAIGDCYTAAVLTEMPTTINSWAQGSDSAAITGTFIPKTNGYMNGQYFMQVAGENDAYRMEAASTVSGSTITTFSRRLGATIGSSTVSYLKEKVYTIFLTDDEHVESNITISDNIAIRIDGNGTRLSSGSATNAVFNRAATAYYGRLEFSPGIVLSRKMSEVGIMSNGGGSNGFNDANLIDIFIYSNIAVNGVDMFSPAIKCGTVEIDTPTINYATSGGAAHLFYFYAQGYVKGFNITYNLTNELAFSAGDFRPFDLCHAKKVILLNHAVYINDSGDKITEVLAIGSPQNCGEWIVDGITFVCSDASNMALRVCDNNAASPDFATNFSMLISNITAIAPNITGTIKIINDDGASGSENIVATIVRCSDNWSIDSPQGGSHTSTINYRDNPYLQTLTPVGNTITPNANLGNNIELNAAIAAGLTVAAPINPLKGQELEFMFLQDGTGSFVITWNAVFKVHTNVTGTANQRGTYKFKYDGTNWVQMSGGNWA